MLASHSAMKSCYRQPPIALMEDDLDDRIDAEKLQLVVGRACDEFLSPRERRVIEGRLDDRTYKDIGIELGVSVERTRQIFHKAERKLRFHLKRKAAVFFDGFEGRAEKREQTARIEREDQFQAELVRHAAARLKMVRQQDALRAQWAEDSIAEGIARREQREAYLSAEFAKYKTMVLADIEQSLPGWTDFLRILSVMDEAQLGVFLAYGVGVNQFGVIPGMYVRALSSLPKRWISHEHDERHDIYFVRT